MRKRIYRIGIAFQSKVWSGKEKMSEMGFRRRRPCLLMRIRAIKILSSWHRAIFPQGFPYSIVTVVEFNHQVRDGLVWFLYAWDTRISNHERGGA
jgi:hypothetical protein